MAASSSFHPSLVPGSSGTSLSGAPAGPAGRRGAARLRLGIPARLVALGGTERCDLIDLSCSGARVAFTAALRRLLAPGDGALLRVAGLEAFGEVVRCDSAAIAFAFEESLAHDEVLAVRRHAERLAGDSTRTLRQEARNWVMGGR